MTVRELIAASLQKVSNQDLPVLYDDPELGPQELFGISVRDRAFGVTTYKEIRKAVMAYRNGEEIQVEVPDRVPVIDYHPGVLLS